jgi:hypothetical protein
MQKIIKISRFRITRVRIRYRYCSVYHGERRDKEPGSWCMAFLNKTPENLLISGFATDLATPGRMYILTLSIEDLL